MNQYGGVGFGVGSEPSGVMPSGGIAPYGGGFSASGAAYGPTTAGANAANLAYTRGAVGSDPVYGAAATLLNPNDPTAMRDVALHGAEHAVGTGMVGSGIGREYTGRLRQYDIERRAGLANQLLSGAYGRTPPPVDPWAQSRFDLAANAENNRLLSEIQNRYSPTPAVNVGGGGGRSAPLVIGGGAPPIGGYSSVGPQFPGSVFGSEDIGGGDAGQNWGDWLSTIAQPQSTNDSQAMEDFNSYPQWDSGGGEDFYG